MLITHEMGVIREICDRVVVLERGRVVEQGEVWQVFGDPQHAVTRTLLGTLRHELPDDLQGRLANEPVPGGDLLLDLHFTGASGREPDLLAIAQGLGARVSLLHGGIDRIQGRPQGHLLVRVGLAGLGSTQVLERAHQLADKAEVRGYVAHA